MSKKHANADALGNRMKTYEAVNRTFIIPKLHTVLRLDGKAFHTYTEQFEKPFDDKLIEAMNETAKYLCSKIQGAKFAFVQSDEISIYISDTDKLVTQLWVKGNIQKMVSLSASMAAAKFNHVRMKQIMEFILNKCPLDPVTFGPRPALIDIYDHLYGMQLAEFDSRVFQLPNEQEVVNCFLWRQQDCTRNSIASVAQSLYSQGELKHKNVSDMQEMSFQKGVNWDKLDPKLKRGRFIARQAYMNDEPIAWEQYKTYSESNESPDDTKLRTKWEVGECPIFSQDREFLLSRF